MQQGVDVNIVSQLNQLGISCIANVLSGIKLAKYYEMGQYDIILTLATDSMEMYQSRLNELNEAEGAFTQSDAIAAYHRYLLGQNTDHVRELTYYDRKRIHNLKYYTWIEQQGKTYEEIQTQWYDDEYWEEIPKQAAEIDRLIENFNDRVGLLSAN